MAVPSFGGSLNMLAIECALRRRTVLGGCTETFNSRACSNCKLYIGRYINADPRHIDLFMFQAEISASALREHHYGPYKTLLVGIVMIAIILLG
ncbi:MAG: hypothetical protein FWG35_01030, partial [Spirochaetaceae bacterium]|nr:hypothetical protein [Spirochaetaceae bacterium]